MKKLERILLINWRYFSKQYIDLGDINFLTGLNSAGKTTVIDALQIVLLGETNSYNFNRAASQQQRRTLDGYLYGDEGDNHPLNRRGKDFSTYIVCQFYDTVKDSRFVMGIVFDCYKDGNKRERYFAYDGSLPDHGFAPQNKPMEINDLRKFLQQSYPSKYEMFDTHKAYREYALAKWNVHNPSLMHLMKKAVSFQPIRDIQEFITQNICDIPDKPNIEAMQENIRYYKRQEVLLQQEENKKASLLRIAEAYKKWEREQELLRVHYYVFRKAAYLLESEKLETLQRGLSAKLADKDQVDASIVARQERISQWDEEMKVWERDLYANDIFIQQSKWEDQKKIYTAQLTQEQSQEQQAMLVLTGRITQGLRQCESVAQLDDTMFTSVRTKARDLVEQWKGARQQDIATMPDYFFNLSTAETDWLQETYSLEQQLYRQLEDTKEHIAENRETLRHLHNNVKDYPKALLALQQLLQKAITQAGYKGDVTILADVLEINSSDELWRGAIEGYLHTQKLYLLVPPEAYETALCTYNKHRHEFNKDSFGLIDVARIRERERIQVHGNSLARKVQTNHEGARLYIDYILGQVVACEDVSQLRNYSISITKEGMLYKGYVARPLHKRRMENSYIGARAIQLRIERLTRDLQDQEAYVTQWTPYYNALHRLQAYMPMSVVENDVQRLVDTTKRIASIQQELAAIAEALQSIDLMWVEAQQKKIENQRQRIQAEQTLLQKDTVQLGRLESDIQRLQMESIPEQQRLYEEASHCMSSFDDTFITQEGEPMWLTIVKEKGKHWEKIRNDAAGTHKGYQTRAEKSEQQWRELRIQYVNDFGASSQWLQDDTNARFQEKLEQLESSELPEYKEKIQKAKRSAMEQFENDFLARLKASIDQVTTQVKQLNKALTYAKFGSDSYQFKVEKNPTYAEYYDMIMAPELMEGDGGLFASPFQEKYGALIDQLFQMIVISDDENNKRRQSELQMNIEKYTDFRTYLRFDLETTDEEGRKQLLSKTIHTKSGGETQTPFYIAIFASFAQLYQINNKSDMINNTMRLVVFDEAFNKMDSERILESIALLRRLGLQAIICTPPEKAADIGQAADRILLVSRDKNSMQVTKWEKSMAVSF